MAATRWRVFAEVNSAKEAVENFINCVSNMIKQSTSEKIVLAKTSIIKPWMTPGILKSFRKRDRLHRKYIENPSNIRNKRNFIKYRNSLSVVIKKAKENFAFLISFNLLPEI